MKNGSAFDYFVYSSVRHRINYLSRESYRRYLQTMKSSLLSNSKYFYKLKNDEIDEIFWPNLVFFESIIQYTQVTSVK